MDAKKCLEELRKIKDVVFSTVDDKGMPKARIIDVMIVEDEKLYFCTARGKDFYNELMSSGYVVVTTMTEGYQMIRLEGKAKKLEDSKKWIDRIFDENPCMNDIYAGDSRYILEPFIIDNGFIEIFDIMQTPLYRDVFTLGKGDIKKKGFFITDKCIGCGKCKEACPENCIEEGGKYSINHHNCLTCGTCYEVCPVNAVERL